MTSITPQAIRDKPRRAARNRWDANLGVAARNASPDGVVIQATRDFTVKTVQKAADIAMQAGSRLYTDSASSYRLLTGYAHESVNHTK